MSEEARSHDFVTKSRKTEAKLNIHYFTFCSKRRRSGRRGHEDNLSTILMTIVGSFLVCNTLRSAAWWHLAPSSYNDLAQDLPQHARDHCHQGDLHLQVGWDTFFSFLFPQHYFSIEFHEPSLKIDAMFFHFHTGWPKLTSWQMKCIPTSTKSKEYCWKEWESNILMNFIIILFLSKKESFWLLVGWGI